MSQNHADDLPRSTIKYAPKIATAEPKGIERVIVDISNSCIVANVRKALIRNCAAGIRIMVVTRSKVMNTITDSKKPRWPEAVKDKVPSQLKHAGKI